MILLFAYCQWKVISTVRNCLSLSSATLRPRNYIYILLICLADLNWFIKLLLWLWECLSSCCQQWKCPSQDTVCPSWATVGPEDPQCLPHLYFQWVRWTWFSCLVLWWQCLTHLIRWLCIVIFLTGPHISVSANAKLPQTVISQCCVWKCTEQRFSEECY